MSAAAASSTRPPAGGAGRATRSTGPDAPCAPGPGLLTDAQAERPWALFRLSSATPPSMPPGASTSARVPGLPHRGPGPGTVPNATAHQLPETDRPRRPGGDPDTGQDPDRKSHRHPGPLRPPPHLQRPHRGHQRTPGAPTRHRPGTCATSRTTPPAASSTPDASKTT